MEILAGVIRGSKHWPYPKVLYYCYSGSGGHRELYALALPKGTVLLLFWEWGSEGAVSTGLTQQLCSGITVILGDGDFTGAQNTGLPKGNVQVLM